VHPLRKIWLHASMQALAIHLIATGVFFLAYFWICDWAVNDAKCQFGLFLFNLFFQIWALPKTVRYMHIEYQREASRLLSRSRDK